MQGLVQQKNKIVATLTNYCNTIEKIHETDMECKYVKFVICFWSCI